MNYRPFLRTWLLAAGICCLASPCALRAQGSLTPPGAPAPTMKSLDQLEARIPLNSTNTPGTQNGVYTISQPGSYYLTSNVTVPGANGISNGIVITASDVTLDLNGFTVTGLGSDGVGIFVQGSDVTVRNGHIVGAFTSAGVYVTPGYNIYPNNSLLENMTLQGSGIYVSAEASVISHCSVDGGYINGSVSTTTVGAYGSVCEHCTVVNAPSNTTGISGTIVEDCSASVNSGIGIQGLIVSNSSGVSVSGIGIQAKSVINSNGVTSGTATTSIGVSCASGTATSSQCTSNGGSSVPLSCNLASGCTVAGGTATITHKYFMP